MPTYSYTRLSCFENCPRQYYYQYVARAEREETIEVFLGTLVHEALEKLYRGRMNGRLLACPELLAWFNAEWARRCHDGIAIVRKEYTADDYRRVGEECLSRYYARYTPFNEAVHIALEERIEVPLDSAGRRLLQGYIDRISRSPDGTYEIHDYKTNARLPSQQDQDSDRQLALYQIGLQNRWRDVTRVELVWHFLRHDAEIRSTRSAAQLDALCGETVRLIEDIETRHDEADFPTNESPLCDWCAFQHICPVRKHRVATEDLPAEEYRQETGVQLVGRYAELTARISGLRDQIKALEADRDAVNAALIEYARGHGLEIIVGATHEARIAAEHSVRLPTKGGDPERYAAMEAALRGSRAWPMIAAVDAHRLKRIWNGDEDDPGDVRALLEPFVEEGEETKLRFRRRRDAEPA